MRRHRRVRLGCLLLGFGLGLGCASELARSPAFGQSMTYRFAVRAPESDRENTPVCVLLQEGQEQANLNPVILDEARSVVVTDSDGNPFPAQLTRPGLQNDSANRPGLVAREVHFIVPKLKRGELLKLTASLSRKAPPPGRFAWTHARGAHAELAIDGRPVLRYMCAPLDTSTPEARERTYKVFHHLYDPAGTRFVTKGPGGKYSHHRGLFFGFNRIRYGEHTRIDTWHCGGHAHLSHEKFLAEEAGPVMGRHCVEIDWHGPDDAAFATERREMTVYAVPGGQLVEFASHLESRVGDVRLDGDPQHAGFQFRAAQEVADGDQNLTYYVRPDGRGEPGDTRNWNAKAPHPRCVNLPWNAMSFVVDKKRYTAVYLDKPANPKEARYSERTYGRFGSYFEYDLTDDRPLDVNYRLWLQEGQITGEEAAALSADFTRPVLVVADGS